MMKPRLNNLLLNGRRQLRKVIIGTTGFIVLVVGIAMILLPGPAIVVIPIGLGILSTEFVWAKSLLNKVKNSLKKKREGGIRDETN